MKAIFFDLDNTLSAAEEVGNRFFDPVFSAMKAANDGSVPENLLDQVFTDIWQTAFDAVAAKYCLPKVMVEAGWKEYAELEMKKPMRGYPDLHMLKDLPVKRFLVTSGFRKLQQSKLDALGIAGWFDGVYIDATDEPGHKGKRAIFEEIMAENGFNKADVIVVGDNPESEIEAGNSLGLQTVQILRPGIKQGTTVGRYIHDLSDLSTLIAGQK